MRTFPRRELCRPATVDGLRLPVRIEPGENDEPGCLRDDHPRRFRILQIEPLSEDRRPYVLRRVVEAERQFPNPIFSKTPLLLQVPPRGFSCLGPEDLF